MKIKEQIKEFNKTIKEAEDEIKELRNECEHKDYEIYYYSYRIGCYDPWQFCKECGIILGEPSEKEANEFMAKYWRSTGLIET